MAWTTDISKQGRSWRVAVRGEGLEVEYRYSSLKQARFFAAVIALGPQHLPAAPAPLRKRKSPTQRNTVRTSRRIALLEESVQDLGWAEERLASVSAGELIAALQGAC